MHNCDHGGGCVLILRLLFALACLTSSALAQGFFMGQVNGTPSGGGPVTFTPLHTYFMSATGNDSNNGLSPSTPWLTPNHAVECGDVILANASTSYAGTSGFGNFGTVLNCPSTSGGIDGTGGINFAILLCAGSDLGSNGCQINLANSGNVGMNILANNWAIEGWTCNGGGATSRCFQVYACPVAIFGGPGIVVHHVAFINDVAYDAADGYDIDDCGASGGPNTIGGDYFAVIGSIAQNAAQDSICLAAIDAVGPGQQDANAGTHIYFYGNFSYANANTSCRTMSDTESYMFDTWDAHSVVYQGVIANNIGFDSDRMCVQLFWQGFSSARPTMLIHNNTCFQNNTHTGGDNLDGEININTTANLPWIVTIQDNIAYQPLSVSIGGGAVAAFALYQTVTTFTHGGTGFEDVYKANNSACGGSFCNSGDDAVSNGTSAELGTQIYTNPSFTNTTDLLANQIGVPNCTGFTNVTACMGWNATTMTLTSPSIISDLQAGCAGCSGKGYQLPSTTCASNADYPTWLKGVVYLHASGWTTGATITQNADLVTKPCGL
jgi:hypothetical protein